MSWKQKRNYNSKTFRQNDVQRGNYLYSICICILMLQYKLRSYTHNRSGSLWRFNFIHKISFCKLSLSAQSVLGWMCIMSLHFVRHACIYKLPVCMNTTPVRSSSNSILDYVFWNNELKSVYRHSFHRLQKEKDTQNGLGLCLWTF